MKCRFFCIFIFVTLWTAGYSQTVDEVLDVFPAQKQIHAQLASLQILQAGPEMLSAILKRLDDPQTFEKSSFALTALTHQVVQQPQWRERVSQAYLDHLLSSSVWQPRMFLLQQLQLIADDSAIEPVSTLLGEPTLSHYACRVLVTIDHPACGQALLDAFPEVAEKSQHEIIQALHELHFRDAADLFGKLANDQKSLLANEARSALASLGLPQSSGLLWNAVKELEGYAQIEAWNHLVIWARALEKNGHVEQARSASLKLFHSNAGSQIRAAALGLAVKLKTQQSKDLLWQAMMDTDPVLHKAAADIVVSERPAEVIERIVSEFGEQPPAIRARLLGLVASLQDESAVPLAKESLEINHSGLRAQAMQVLWREDKETMGRLFDAAEKDPEMLPVLQSLLEQESHAILEKSFQKHLSNRSAALTGICLELAQNRHIPLSNRLLNSMFESNDQSVLQAAIGYLGEMGTEKDIDRLRDAVKKNHESKIQAKAGQAMAHLIARSDDSSKHIKQLLEEISKARNKEKTDAMEILARIPTDEAFRAWIGLYEASDTNEQAILVDQMILMQPSHALPWLLDQFVHSKNPASRKTETGIMIRLLGRIDEWSDLQKTVYYSHLLKKGSPDHRRQIVAGLAQLECARARQLLSGCMADSQLILTVSRQLLEQATDREEPDPSAIVNWVSGLNRDEDQDRLQNMFDRQTGLNHAPAGFETLFNGEDLSGWQGLAGDIHSRQKMSDEQLAVEQARADSVMRAHWTVQNGLLFFDGKGQSLCTVKNYHNFELRLDWKIGKHGDSGIYLRGYPQVQIWDPVEQTVGSGGLYNNKEHSDKPQVFADMPVGEWNTFRILMRKDTVTVYLNDFCVVNKVKLENYWQRGEPILAYGPIELQAHNTPLWFRNIFIRELEDEPRSGRVALFNGRDLQGWQQVDSENKNWHIENGILFTEGEGGGWLSTLSEYSDFILDLEFRVPEGGNSGVFLRAPLKGNPAYQGMEIQVLDDYAEKYARLKPWQYTGSIYATQAPKSRESKSAGEWQRMRITCQGSMVEVWLNGKEIVHADLIEYMHLLPDHPGLKRRGGHIGLQNHGTRVDYRNIYLSEL